MKMNKKNMPIIAACISSSVFLIAAVIFGTGLALNFIPVLCAAPAFVYAAVREKDPVNAEKLINESPSVIGMMRLMIDGSHSLDSAVRDIAVNGPKGIAKMFAEVVWNADMRIFSDIRDSLNGMLSSLPDKLAPFRRSMYLLISASDAKDMSERRRMTKDASDAILEAVKQLGETYSSKLNAPCMIIFGIGIMVPLILVSIMPMLSVSGRFSYTPIDPMVIAVIALLLIPAAVAAVIMIISCKNPFYVRSDENTGLRNMFPAFVSVPVFLAVILMTDDLAVSIASSAIVSGSLFFVSLYPDVMKERKKAKIETAMGEALFDLGNRLLSGENFEAAMISSLREKKDCSDAASSSERYVMISRGDTERAIRLTVCPYSERMADLYTKVHVSSQKDLRDAGKLAVSMGHQLQDQNAVMNSIQNKLRSMLDMMISTSSVFAPLILGISVSMIAPLMRFAGASGMSFASPILLVYLIELAALISVLTAQLRCKGGLPAVLHTFGMIMPVSLIVFLISSNIPI